MIAEQMRLMGKDGPIVLEPVGRNTAPALTLAALAAMRDGADPILLVMPAIHVILDTPAFQDVVRQGAALADAGVVITFGITPDSPETGKAISKAARHLPWTVPAILRALSRNLICPPLQAIWLTDQPVELRPIHDARFAMAIGDRRSAFVGMTFFRRVARRGRKARQTEHFYASARMLSRNARRIRSTTR